jgi:hypothetical protein
MSKDSDLNQMDWQRLRDEVATLRQAIRYHRDQKGDERCYLDDDLLYERLPEGKTDVARVLPCNFLENCKQFFEARQNVPFKSVAELYQGWDKDKPYLSPVKLKLIIEMLQYASADMSNSGCNDYLLDNTDENWEFVQGYLEFYGEKDNPEHERPKGKRRLELIDWMVCNYIISEVEKMNG